MIELPTDADDLAWLLGHATREQLVEAILLLHQRVPRNLLTVGYHLRNKYRPKPDLRVVAP